MRGLGELEAVVMDRLWSWRQPATVRDVLDSLRDERELAYTTVMTVMDNLHRKGWLERERVGRAFVYRPVASRQEHSARMMHEALEASRDAGGTLVHFLAEMSEEESAALRRALRRRSRRPR